ncbi:MAG TPA: DUF4232 domain-containing protein [Chloroflexota bacterium]|nr:DUF4232 domain-containing protein [Chloroflexota bacterium]
MIIACLLLAWFGRPPLAHAAGCRLILGFAALQNLIPSVVGACLDDEQHSPLTGDGLQHTTRGLLVWRKADNVTAFSDGFRTWVRGPFGAQERLNTQRFPWEANPAGLPLVVPVAPALQKPGGCHTADLAISQEQGQVAVGNVGVSFRLRSLLAQRCTLYGFPGVQLLDAAGGPLPTYLTWSRSGYLIGTVPEQTITLDPGGSAYFVLEFTDVAGPDRACLAAPSLLVTPPNAYTSIATPVHGVAPCGGIVRASPVLPTDPLAASVR